jgi:uncharacterized GH25 family protein
MKASHIAFLLGLSACVGCSCAEAHDFWLQPNEFWIPPERLTAMTLQVGHGPFRQRSPIPARRIIRLQAVAPSGTATDLRGNLRLGDSVADGDFRLTDPGVHILVLQTDDRAQTHLPAIRFNDYLKVEGLTPAVEQRTRLQRTDSDGSERYSRCAKSIVQVGPADGAKSRSGSQVVTPIGLPLEIVPEANPYAIPRSANLPIRVIYENHPLAGALVKLTNLNDDANAFEVHLTDQSGRAIFTLPTSGSWLLNVIWTKALMPSEEVEFETVFSSLSFGFPPTSTDR